MQIIMKDPHAILAAFDRVRYYGGFFGIASLCSIWFCIMQFECQCAQTARMDTASVPEKSSVAREKKMPEKLIEK